MLDDKTKQEINLFRGKFNCTVRYIAPSKKTSNKIPQPSNHQQASDLFSCDSRPNLSQTVMIPTNHTSHKTSLSLCGSSGNQTQTSMSFSDDEEGWIHVSIKQKPIPSPSQSNERPQARTLQEIRLLLNDLYNERYDKEKMLRFPSIKTRKIIEKAVDELTKDIEMYKRESRLREIEHIKKSPHLINIHDGYRSEEIKDIFTQICKTLQEEYKKGNQLIFPEKRNRRWVICLKILTGRGNHSTENISVLKECVYKWAKSMPGFECTPQADHALLYIPMTH